ncbi:MAG: hypothetical protein LIO71_04680 [Ruminococcus sp.]|nr:hypothetical protein [Ruminococcus sp.]
MKVKVRKLNKHIPKRIVKLIIESQQDRTKSIIINLKDVEKRRQEYYKSKNN